MLGVTQAPRERSASAGRMVGQAVWVIGNATKEPQRIQQKRETLELAIEAGTNFAGVLCGRATWKDGIPIYAKQGVKAFEDWLNDRGVQNITALNGILKGAHPWYEKYGGLDKIQIV